MKVSQSAIVMPICGRNKNTNFKGNCVNLEKTVKGYRKQIIKDYMKDVKANPLTYDSDFIKKQQSAYNNIIDSLKKLAGKFPKQFNLIFQPSEGTNYTGGGVESIPGFAQVDLQIPGVIDYTITNPKQYDPYAQLCIADSFRYRLTNLNDEDVQKFCDKIKPEKVLYEILYDIKRIVDSGLEKNSNNSEKANLVLDKINKLDVYSRFLDDYPEIKSKVTEIKDNLQENYKTYLSDAEKEKQAELEKKLANKRKNKEEKNAKFKTYIYSRIGIIKDLFNLIFKNEPKSR